MNYQNGERINLMDTVKTDAGQVGTVVGFDKIGERNFVIIRTNSAFGADWGTKQIWVSDNAIERHA